MTAHAVHDMHENSLAAYASLDICESQSVVLSVYMTNPPMTDRECLAHMGMTDTNAVRPRTTELIKKKLLKECRSVKCPVTGKTVRVCRPTAKARGAL